MKLNSNYLNDFGFSLTSLMLWYFRSTLINIVFLSFFCLLILFSNGPKYSKMFSFRIMLIHGRITFFWIRISLSSFLDSLWSIPRIRMLPSLLRISRSLLVISSFRFCVTRFVKMLHSFYMKLKFS